MRYTIVYSRRQYLRTLNRHKPRRPRDPHNVRDSLRQFVRLCNHERSRAGCQRPRQHLHGEEIDGGHGLADAADDHGTRIVKGGVENDR